MLTHRDVSTADVDRAIEAWRLVSRDPNPAP
jgi:hypothetical protein